MSELENRRLNLTTVFSWGGRDWLVTAGFDRDGRCREVFADGLREGSAWQRTVTNGCRMMSFNLQHRPSKRHDGPMTLEELLADMRTYQPDGDRVSVPCIFETILAAALKVEQENQTAMREAYECFEGRDPWRAHLRATGRAEEASS